MSAERKCVSAQRITVATLLVVLTVLIFNTGCQMSDMDYRNIDHIEGELAATLAMDGLVEGRVGLTWTADISPSRWIIQKYDNGTATERTGLEGNSRSWTDTGLRAGHSYIFDIVAETGDTASPGSKVQIQFKRITIDVLSYSERQNYLSRGNCDGILQRPGGGYAMRFTWNSSGIPGMSYWVVEKQVNGRSNPVNEVQRRSPIAGSYEYTDSSIVKNGSYIYDIVAVGEYRSTEGHLVQARFAIASFIVDLEDEIVDRIF